MTTPITGIKGIGEVTAKILADHGYQSAEDMAKASVEDLAKIQGFGEARAMQVISEAQSLSAQTTEIPEPEVIKEKKSNKKASSKKGKKQKKKEKGKKEKKKKKHKKDKKDKKGKKKK